MAALEASRRQRRFSFLRPTDELVQDVIAGYFDELAQVRATLDPRYDDIKSGRVKPIDGEAFFESLRKTSPKFGNSSPRITRWLPGASAKKSSRPSVSLCLPRSTS